MPREVQVAFEEETLMLLGMHGVLWQMQLCTPWNLWKEKYMWHVLHWYDQPTWQAHLPLIDHQKVYPAALHHQRSNNHHYFIYTIYTYVYKNFSTWSTVKSLQIGWINWNKIADGIKMCKLFGLDYILWLGETINGKASIYWRWDFYFCGVVLTHVSRLAFEEIVLVFPVVSWNW